MSSYPTSIPDLTALVVQGMPIESMNTIADEIEAIMNTLGTNPQGSYGTVANRFGGITVSNTLQLGQKVVVFNSSEIQGALAINNSLSAVYDPATVGWSVVVDTSSDVCMIRRRAPGSSTTDTVANFFPGGNVAFGRLLTSDDKALTADFYSYSNTASFAPQLRLFRGRIGGAGAQINDTLGDVRVVPYQSAGGVGTTGVISWVATETHTASVGGTKMLVLMPMNGTRTLTTQLSLDQGNLSASGWSRLRAQGGGLQSTAPQTYNNGDNKQLSLPTPWADYGTISISGVPPGGYLIVPFTGIYAVMAQISADSNAGLGLTLTLQHDGLTGGTSWFDFITEFSNTETRIQVGSPAWPLTSGYRIRVNLLNATGAPRTISSGAVFYLAPIGAA